MLLQRTARKVADILGRQSRLIRTLRPAYESLLDLSSRGRGIRWPINGVKYRIDPRFRHQMGSNYDPSVAAYFRERVRDGMLCIDVGANVGVYVLQLARWNGPSGRVIAFEPNPAARAVLNRHVALNGISSRVDVISMAVSSSPGQATLFAPGADGTARLGSPNPMVHYQSDPVSVAVTTLDEFCASRSLKPDWLLIDIEGFEVEALRGATQLLGRHRGKIGIVVEMHPALWESAGSNRCEAERLVRDLRLRAVPLTGQRDCFEEHGIVAFET